MKITDIVNWKEICEDFEVSPVTEKSFMEYFDLDGKIMMRKEFQEYKGFNGESQMDLGFYCGPSIGDYCVSDSVYIGEYLSKICSELNIDCDIDEAENYHILYGVPTIQMASVEFDRIKDRISKDFEVEIEPYYSIE